jgi:hypothetical protein
MHPFDPALLSNARANKSRSVACVAGREPQQAKHASQVWTGGTSESGRGCLSVWSTASGALLSGAQLDAGVMSIALVETARPSASLRAAPAPLRGRSAADSPLGCELLLWCGLDDGRIVILSGTDLRQRASLAAHHGAVACICAPAAPPSALAQGSTIVLSGGADCCMRLWDARTSECVRTVQCGGAEVRAMLALWVAAGSTRASASCRVWSAAANSTLSLWEPRQALLCDAVLCCAVLCCAVPCDAMPCHAMRCDAMRQAREQGAATGEGKTKVISLNADARGLAASSDGRLVCAAVGEAGVA